MVERLEIYVANKRLPGLNPLTFGEERCQPLHLYGPGTRPYWLLHYVVSGKGLFVADEKTYKVSASQCFIVKPEEKIFYQADEHDPWHYIWIAFSSDMRQFPHSLYREEKHGIRIFYINPLKPRSFLAYSFDSAPFCKILKILHYYTNYYTILP
jgi:hypothetical protein